MVTTVNGYPYKPRSTNNVVPLTYRDGTTYLEQLESIRVFLNDTLVPEVNAAINSILDDIGGQVDRAIEAGEQSRVAFLALLEQYREESAGDAKEFTDRVEALVSAINNRVGPASLHVVNLTAGGKNELAPDPTWPSAHAVTVMVRQDSVGGHLMAYSADHFPDARIFLRNKPNAVTLMQLIPLGNGKWRIEQPLTGFTDDSMADAILANIVKSPTSTTRIALDKNTNTLVSAEMVKDESAINTALTSATDKHVIGEYAEKGGTLNLATATFVNSTNREFPVPFRTFGEKLAGTTKRGANPPATVVILGDSTSSGAGASIPSTRWVNRIADYLGAGTIRDLNTTNSAPGSGIGFYSGSVGGSSSANYFRTNYADKLRLVMPDVVIHMVGANDYAAKTAVTTFRDNVKRVVDEVRATVPNAVQLLVHQHSRTDVAANGPAWELYGQELAAIAKTSANVTYLNADDHFRRMGLTPALDRPGLLNGNATELNDTGHKILADLISEFIGIPIIYGGDEFYQAAEVAGGLLPAGGERQYGGVVIPARPYPRRLDATFSTIGGSEVRSYLSIKAFNYGGTNAALPGRSLQILITGPWSSYSGTANFIVPANEPARVSVEHDGTSKYLANALSEFQIGARLTAL